MERSQMLPRRDRVYVGATIDQRLGFGQPTDGRCDQQWRTWGGQMEHHATATAAAAAAATTANERCTSRERNV
jgi:hypothetical protein